jgi:uncharacterized membrane protein
VKRFARYALAVFFVLAGINHFVSPDFYLQMMPAYLPWHEELVVLSGVLEVGGGLCVLAPSIREAAGRGLVLLLIAILPANVNMALHPELFPDIPEWALYARLPLQLVFIGWAWWATRPDAAAEVTGAA